MTNTTALTTTMNTLLSVQTAIKTYLEANKVNADSDAVTAHPAIATLLGKDRSAIVDPINFNFSALSALQSDSGDKKDGKKQPRDPTLPKRPQTAYFLYAGANRERVTKDNPTMKPGEIAKKCTEDWNKLPKEDQQV